MAPLPPHKRPLQRLLQVAGQRGQSLWRNWRMRRVVGVVGGGDEDGVDLGAEFVEHFPEVGELGDFGVFLGDGEGGAAAEVAPVDVTEGDDFFVEGGLDGAVAHLADADDGDADFLGGGLGAEEGGGAEGGEGGGFEEVAAGCHEGGEWRVESGGVMRSDDGYFGGREGRTMGFWEPCDSLFSVLGLRWMELGERLAERRGAVVSNQ